MSKFYLFIYTQYEGGGGINDLHGTYDTISSAEHVILMSANDMAHIATIDQEGDLVIVAEYERSHGSLSPIGELDYKTHVPPRWLKQTDDGKDVYKTTYEVLQVAP